MTYGHYEIDIMKLLGGFADGVAVSVAVTNEATSAPANLYDGKETGSNALDNPVVTSDANLNIYTTGGWYKIVMTGVGVSRTLRDVAIGSAQAMDAGAISQSGRRYLVEVETVAPPSAGCVRFNNVDLSAATKAYFSDTTQNGDDMGASILALDPGSKTIKNRILAGTADSGITASYAVDTTTDQSGYVEVDLSAHDGATALPLEPIRVEIEHSGANGSNGASAFHLTAYASDASGTDFTMTLDEALKYKAELSTTTAIASPVVGDFAGLWVKHIGDDGVDGDDGIAGGGMIGMVLRAASTTYIDLSSALENGDSAGGVVLASNNVFGALGQTAPEENGIYVVQASGAAVRHADFASYDAICGGLFTVSEGTEADKLYQCTSNKGGTIDTTALVFAEFTSGGGVTAGQSIAFALIFG